MNYGPATPKSPVRDAGNAAIWGRLAFRTRGGNSLRPDKTWPEWSQPGAAASDRLANPPSTARDAELLSQPVLIDQTPPRVTLSNQRRNGNTVEIDVEASDDASPIRRAEFSLNGSVWRLMEPADGITDGRAERFAVRFIAVSPEVSVVVRVFDAAGNPGLARAVVR